ncbi:tigger transposable element-derived protein 2-like [Branchiostoma floridae]|uniref:Tigger transposable element-derived protein 2-like n=1 Tax=Branchiostoma floridae TaxID=7739 RepID=A0A9J7KGY2_BRAFL|nr:tigger transposable element-derived protein 2-like [Branchiostoma floridae]
MGVLATDSEEETPEVKPRQCHAPNDNSRKLEILETQRRKQWSNRQAAKHFGVAEASIRKWKLLEDRLAAAPASRKRLSGGGQKAKNPELARTLMEWMDVQMKEGVLVSGAMLKSEARRILGDDDSFKASNGWLSCLKKRHGLRCTKRGKNGFTSL